MTKERRITQPVLPLRDIVVFPHMVAPLFVGRKMSINALNKVMLSDKKILLITQKSSDIDNPSPKNLYNFVLNLYDKKNKKLNINMEDEIISKTLIK